MMRSSGRSTPTSPAIVGKRSIVAAISLQTAPAGDLARKTHDARLADTALESGPLAFPERQGGARVIAVGEPGPVVGGEDDQGIVGEFQAA